MIISYPAYVSKTFNDKIYPLAAIMLQKIILTKKISEIMDLMMENIPDMKAKSLMDYIIESGIINKNIDILLESVNREKQIFMEANSIVNFNFTKNPITKKLTLESSIEFSKTKLNAPTFATIERRDPDGYVRSLIIGVYLKTIYMKPEAFKVLLTSGKQTVRSFWRILLHKFTHSLPIISTIERWFDVLFKLMRKEYGSTFMERYKTMKKYNLYKKVVTQPDTFFFFSEADILNAWGEEIPIDKFKDFYKDLGWKNYIIDLPSIKNIIYIGEFSHGGANMIPYQLLLSEVSDRIRLDDYESIASKSERGMRFHISMNKAYKIISKAIKR